MNETWLLTALLLCLSCAPILAQGKEASAAYREPLRCQGITLNPQDPRLQETFRRILKSDTLIRKQDTGDVGRLVFTPDASQVIALSSKEDWAKIWSLPNLELLREFDINIFPAPTEAAVALDGHQMTLANYKYSETWDLRTGMLLGKGLGPKRQETRSVSSGLAAATYDGATVVWEMESKKVLARFPDPDSRVRHLRINQQGTMIAIAHESPHNKGGHVTLWSLPNKRRLLDISYDRATFTFLRFAPDGSYLLAGAYNGRIILWDLKSSKLRGSFHNGQGLRSVSLGPKGRLISIAGGGPGESGVMALWDAQTCQPVLAFRLTKRVASALLDKSGQYWCFGSWNGGIGVFRYKEFQKGVKAGKWSI